MKLRLLSLEETKRIYDRYLVRDFPPAERKPFASIRQLMEAGLYEPLGAEAEDGRLLAYAWQTVVPGCASALLDYFAVCPKAAAGAPAPRCCGRWPPATPRTGTA